MTQSISFRNVVATAAAALKNRSEEVNRLNVFPVPDGDTGTNMSLTLEAVAADVAKLPTDASLEDICKAATHGSLMGARGNSGVISSQIIRGACEGLVASDGLNPTERLALALESATTVAFQAVRKPVEGTILTVVKDMATAARGAAEGGIDFVEALELVSSEAHSSVRRTPELLPVLKEAGVVDAGGFGLAIYFDGLMSAILGREVIEVPLTLSQDTLKVVPVDDWDDDEFLYCTEFLLFGEGIDKESVHDFIADHGGSELIVGDDGQFKVHVHTNDPSEVLSYCLGFGEIAEVHIHNMRRQQEERSSEQVDSGSAVAKNIGIVGVASGSGLEQILKSLGVDCVVSGGQTMNPSTQDLVDAAEKLNADHIILLPNNKNIVMAANAAATVLDKPAAVIPTRSVPEAFAALFMYDPSGDFETVVEDMTDALDDVRTAEITTAIKDAKGKVGDIHAGQVIGIIDGNEIEAVGDNIEQVALSLLDLLVDKETETVTLLFGADYSDEQGASLVDLVADKFDWLEVETHRGEQPLYPVLISVE